MSKVALVVTLTLAPGTRDQFLARVAQHRETCLAQEEGCLQFDVLEPTEGGDQILLYEVYADHAAVETHLSTDHMKAYLEEVGPWITDRRRRACNIAHG